MINAADAKRIAEKCDINKELEYIEKLIKEATEDGEMYCYLPVEFVAVLSIIKRKKIINALEDYGYEIQDGNMVSWEKAEDGEEWVERKRYDGSIFYVCGSCGGVAAAEKEDSCPNCKCRMRK